MHGIIAALFGPIFAKEMVEMARRRRYFFNRVFFGSVVLFAVWMVWIEYASRFRHGSSNVQLMAEMGASLFLVINIVQYSAVYLFVPLFLCGVIASEREERTLDLVFTTDLTNREIILGKFMSRALALVLLILLVLPIISILMLFGGITPSAIWRTVASTLLAILFAGAHAIYFSATTKSTLGALVRTYWWLIVWMLGLPLLVLFGASLYARYVGNFMIVRTAAAVICYVNPLGPFILSQEVEAYNSIANEVKAYVATRSGARSLASSLAAWFYPLMFAVPVLMSLGLIVQAIRRVRHEPLPAFAYLLMVKRWLRIPSWLRRPPAVQMARREGRAERTWYGMRVLNPLWWRARIARVYDREGHVGRIQWLAWGAVALFLAMFIAFDARDLADAEAAIAFLAPVWSLVCLMTVVFAATSLVGDRRRGFLELVMVTPLTPREVIDGTLLAIWQHLRRIYALPVGIMLFLTLVVAPWLYFRYGVRAETRFIGYVFSFITASLFLAVVAIYGVACSIVARTLASSLVMGMLLPVFFLVAPPLLVAIFKEAHGPVTWVATPLLFLLAWGLVTARRPNVVTLGIFMMTFHFLLVAWLTAWTHRTDRFSMEPMQNYHPGFLTLVVLASNFEREFRGHAKWWMVYPIYWSALVVTFFWVRWWVIRHFDRLTGRTRRRELPLAKPRPLPVQSMAEKEAVSA